MTGRWTPTENRTPMPYLSGPSARSALLLTYVTAPPETELRVAIGVVREGGTDTSEVVVAVTLGTLRVAFPARDARLMAVTTEVELALDDTAPPDLARRLSALAEALHLGADRAEEAQAIRRARLH